MYLSNSRISHDIRYFSPLLFFFFNDPATTEIYTLSLHDALPIFVGKASGTWPASRGWHRVIVGRAPSPELRERPRRPSRRRSEEHTSELQSHHDLVCRLLLEKKKKTKIIKKTHHK